MLASGRVEPPTHFVFTGVGWVLCCPWWPLVALHLPHLGPFNLGLVASGNDTYVHHGNFKTFLSPLATCDSTDTKGHGSVSVQDKNNGYWLLSSSAFVPGSC